MTIGDLLQGGFSKTLYFDPLGRAGDDLVDLPSSLML